jgi:ElaB/YqjD/DUF883 family membrane-anchored ribosome-binding protein
MARRSKFMESYEAMKEKLEDAKDKIKELEDEFEDKITEHPVQSVAIAFGAGIAAGALLHMLAKRKR